MAFRNQGNEDKKKVRGTFWMEKGSPRETAVH